MSEVQPNSLQLFVAPWVVLDADTVLQDAGLLVRAGRVEQVLPDRHAIQWAMAEHPGISRQSIAGVLAPGWVNAHAHLELSSLAGEIPSEGGFVAWVGRLVAAKAEASPESWAQGVQRGAQRLLETGTTCVGDIDSVGVGVETLARTGLRGVQYIETYDAHDPERTSAALEALRTATSTRQPSERVAIGLAPHAGFTVSATLLEEVAQCAREGPHAVTMHWAETAEELEWLRTGQGPMSRFLGPSPRELPLAGLQRCGLLGPNLSLVHGNHPEPGDWQRLGDSGTSVVHCPGSHAFFGREPFALRAALEAGVSVGLGTDSWASNEDLNMAREVVLLRQAHPWLPAREAFRFGTAGAADALGLGERVGHLRPGAAADCLQMPLAPTNPHQVWEALTSGVLPERGWVGGVPRFG